MKALTLYQPYATAIALGLKTAETRSWSTTYRGPLAVHAAQQRPATGIYGGHRVEPWYDEVNHVEDCGCEPGGVDVPCARRSKGRMVLTEETSCWPHTYDLPRGAVVATCRLVDVVTTSDLTFGTEPGWRADVERNGADYVESVYVGPDQLPWGDFSPGRWAWLLDDVKPTTERCPECRNQFGGRMPGHIYGSAWEFVPCRTCHGVGRCDPVPAKGARGLWEWTP